MYAAAVIFSHRQYEQGALDALPDEDAVARAAQQERVRSLYVRQLAVPLADLSAVQEAYKAWEAALGRVSGYIESELLIALSCVNRQTVICRSLQHMLPVNGAAPTNKDSTQRICYI